MISRRHLLGASLGAPLVATLGSPRSLAAQGPEPIRMLLWWDYVTVETMDAYRAATGGELFVRGIGANDEIFTFLRAGRNRYSVVSPHQGVVRDLYDVGLIQPLDPAKLPRLAEVDPHFNDDRWFMIGEQRYGVPLTFGSSPLVYSAKHLPEPPAEWTDLFDQAFAGKLAMLDDGLGHLMHWSSALGLPDPSELTPNNLSRLLARLTTLKRDNVGLFSPSLGEITAALVRGDVLATTTGWEGIPMLPEAEGGDLRLAHPQPADYSFLHCLCIPADAPDVEGAHRFIDFMLSAEQQAALAMRVKRGVVNLAAVPLLSEPVRAYFDYDNLDATLTRSPLRSFPPTNEASSDGIATYVDWVNGWERIRLVKMESVEPTPTP